MVRLLTGVAALAVLATTALAQQGKQTRFWNLTLYTVTHMQMSPAGQDKWGPDQCANDRDGTVDHNERLRITGITSGRYDVKLTDKIGRKCTVRNVEVAEGTIFTIEEKQLTDCGK